ncbi:MAG: DNA primase [Elusimicrobia bacterium]|nr:DNA primase [Elusimicrobiota bacterium]
MSRENNVEKVRRYTDIVTLIEEYIPLRRAGVNYKALCPFHQEKTPSFVISPEKQIFHCFGCGQSGDVFSFIMQMEGLDFPGALRRLAERSNVEIEVSDASDGKRAISTQLYELNLRAASFYSKCLMRPSGVRALDYLKARGVSLEMIEKFNLGYAPEANLLVKNALKEGIDRSILKSADLAYENHHGRLQDKFRGRLVFPIRDGQGRTIGFGGRVIADGKLPKYLNTSQTEVFEKKRVLYGFYSGRDAIRKKKRIVVLEGYMDVVAAHQFGFEEASAVLGTALTGEHVYKVKRLADEVILAFDADDAGVAATQRGLKSLLDSDMRGRVCLLPKSTDPEDIIRESPEKFATLLEKSIPIIEWSLENSIKQKKHMRDRLSAKSEIVREMVEVIGKVNDPVKNSEAVKLVAERLKISETAVLQEMRRHLRGQSSYIKEKTSTKRDSRKEKLAREMLHVLIHKPEYSSEIKEVLRAVDFIEDNYYARLLDLYINKYKGDIKQMIVHSTEEDKKILAEITLSEIASDSVFGYLKELKKDVEKFLLQIKHDELLLEIKELVEFNKPVPENLNEEFSRLGRLLR